MFSFATTQGAGASSSRILTTDIIVRVDNDSPEITECHGRTLQSLSSIIDSSTVAILRIGIIVYLVTSSS